MTDWTLAAIGLAAVAIVAGLWLLVRQSRAVGRLEAQMDQQEADDAQAQRADDIRRGYARDADAARERLRRLVDKRGG